MEITEAQYNDLITYGSVGAAGLEKTTEFEELRTKIEAANGMKRYTLLVRFQAVPQQPAVVGEYADYPPGQTTTIQLYRPITRQDVDDVLVKVETLPDLVFVTPDPQGRVGWALLNSYNFNYGA